MTKMSANRFINVAEQFGDKSNTMLLFNPTALYALAAPSTPESVRAEVLENAENGIIKTNTEIEEMKRVAKQASVKDLPLNLLCSEFLL